MGPSFVVSVTMSTMSVLSGFFCAKGQYLLGALFGFMAVVGALVQADLEENPELYEK